MENQIDDPLFKIIVLATIGCSILFVTNQSPASIGKAAKQPQSQQVSVKASSQQQSPILKSHLKSNH
jgi:hypothetical protein